jgi:O-antigen/teichoic acid export membrane protein
MKPANRIVFNTAVLYGKLIAGMAIGLFTTRIVLDALGEKNYGIYALVGGMVGMLGILNAAMSGASVRFIAHSLGSEDLFAIRKTFNTTLAIHFFIGAIVVVIMEIGGWFMFEYLVNIPPESLSDAKIVFHFMVLTTFVAIISVPYDAVMNAHENMLALSVVDIIGYTLKLGVAIYLTYTSANLLVIYALLMFVVQLILRIIKQIYSRIKYDDCAINFRTYFDKALAKTIFAYSGWNLFGNIASVSVSQVRGIILNMFFGVTINAADGISKTASSQVNLISTSMTRAIHPQMIKSEGGGDRKKMLKYTQVSTRYSIFLFALAAVPVLIETNYLLNLWLKDVPEYAVIFVRLMLINAMLSKFTFEIVRAIQAVGKIREFQVTESVLYFLNIPVAYMVFKLGAPPYAIFVVFIAMSLLIALMRLYFGKHLTSLNIVEFLKYGILPALFPVACAFVLALLAQFFLEEGFLRLLIVTVAGVSSLSILFWYLAVDASEASKLKEMYNLVLVKLRFNKTRKNK